MKLTSIPKAALRSTTDEHLMTKWRLLSGGAVAMETSRYVMIRDTIVANNTPDAVLAFEFGGQLIQRYLVRDQQRAATLGDQG